MPILPSPINLQATESPLGTVLLTWEYSSTVPARYEIQRRDLFTVSWTTIDTTPASNVIQVNHSYSDVVGLGETRRYRIRAVDGVSDPSPYTKEIVITTASNFNVSISFESYVEERCEYIMLRDTSGVKYSAFNASDLVAHYEIYDKSETLITKATTSVSEDPTFWRPLQWEDFSNGKPVEGVYKVVYYVMYQGAEVGRSFSYIVLGCSIEKSLLDLATKTVRINTACCHDPVKQDLCFLVSLWTMAIPSALKEQSLDKADQMFERLRRELDCIC